MATDKEPRVGQLPRQNDASDKTRTEVDRGMDHASHKIRRLIAAKLGKEPQELTEHELGVFVVEFLLFCKNVRKKPIERRHVLHWLDAPNSSVYQKHQSHILSFFQQHLPFVDQPLLLLNRDEFDAAFQRDVISSAQSVVIEFPVPLGVLSPEDHTFLCGIYELYRYSFANDGDINLDILILAADEGHPNRLKMEVIGAPLTKDGKTESFVGHLYCYGRSLLGVPVFADHDPTHARVRRYEFPSEGLARTRENLLRIGIVAGNSIQLAGPVAARCLISKLSNSRALLPEYLKIVGRYPAAPRPLEKSIYEPYVSAISNDVRRYPDRVSEQDDYLLNIRSARKPRARPRQSYPPLPHDAHDPRATPQDV
jgi:hypothetical protein